LRKSFHVINTYQSLKVVMFDKYYGIVREGFACSYGRFYAHPEHVERESGEALRNMFLPAMTSEGRKRLNEFSKFVRGQLKHYGVQFDESQISGNGTLLLKKVLTAGKCDNVPEHIVKLREEMHMEWLETKTPEELSTYPEWVMDRYFMTSGQPDCTKTTTVVGIPLDRYSSYRSGQMCEAAKKVGGLHHARGLGPKTQTIFMGWDLAAVSKAAKEHAAKEAKVLKAADDERDSERATLHADYLRSLNPKKNSKKSKKYSPVGSYIVDCKDIEEGWSNQADELSIDIQNTDQPGIFEASFDFGVLEGIMILGKDETTLEEYCSRLDLEAESEDDEDDFDDEDGTEEDGKPVTGGKRKAEAPRGPLRPAKKSKSKAALSRTGTYHLRLKCRETGEGEINYSVYTGLVKFEDDKMASFLGNADLPCVGQGVPFTARKISDSPNATGNSWADYSESAYNYANSRRWG
jgi:hypothetical protein